MTEEDKTVAWTRGYSAGTRDANKTADVQIKQLKEQIREEQIREECEREGKKLPNLIWAKGMMEEMDFGMDLDWYEDFDKYFDILSKGPLKGERDGYIERVALQLTIMNDGNDPEQVEFTIDREHRDEPRWINIKIRYHYGS